MKMLITVGILVVGTLGGWLGALLDNGNWFGGWSILGTAVGSLAGIYIAYKVGRYWLGL